MMVIIGVIFFVLFLIWLIMIVRIWFLQVMVEWNDELVGNNNNFEGIVEDFEEFGVEELVDVFEFQLVDVVEVVMIVVLIQKVYFEVVEGNVV